jgi:hypothetical protein
MGRLVQLLLLIALAVIVWRLVRRALAPPAAPPTDAPRFEPMARCDRCGTHVPRAQLDASGTCARCRA